MTLLIYMSNQTVNYLLYTLLFRLAAVQTSLSVNPCTDFEAFLGQWMQSQAQRGMDAGISICESYVERPEGPYLRHSEALCSKCNRESSTSVTVPYDDHGGLDV